MPVKAQTAAPFPRGASKLAQRLFELPHFASKGCVWLPLEETLEQLSQG